MEHPPQLFELFSSALPVALQALAACTLVVLLLVWRVRRDLAHDPGVIPQEQLTLRNALEMLLEALVSLAKDTMGDKWPRYLPLVGTMGLFILVSNLMGVVPFFTGPTSYVETNVTWALFAFCAFNYAGIRENGVRGYLRGFAGPVWWLAWLMWPLEVWSTLVRVASLTIRLTANMFADHTLVAVFLSFSVVQIFIPWAIMGLGVFVAFVQAFIFSFLTMIYIGQAIEQH